MRLLASFLLSLLIGALAYRRGSLSRSGWAGAVLVGTLTAGLGGWDWGLLVIVFFVSSSALSRVGARHKTRFADAQWEKGDRRDLGQVLANGGLASLLALLAWLWPASGWWPAAVGALATATADTWATEVGVLSRRAPRLATSWRPVPAGTSGAVSALGSLAALAGALCIGLAALVFGRTVGGAPRIEVLLAAVAGGSVGVLCDSLLGATFQAVRRCPRCGGETERDVHSCGTPTEPLRGLSWLRNDAVNALSTAAGAVAATITVWL